MKRKLPTILILMVMMLVGAMYWVDLSYYTHPQTGFIVRGYIWQRYIIMALPLVMCLLGLRTVGPRAISVLRVKSNGLGGIMLGASGTGLLYGVAQVLTGIGPRDWYKIILGMLLVWYAVWMFLAALQLFTQSHPAPTYNAIWGVLAALPFAMITVNRIIVRPSSLHRMQPLVSSFSALFAMLWFGLLLRSLYIALPRSRVRWMYLTGVFTFLFSTSLELFQTLHNVVAGQAGPMALMESLFMAAFGLVAGCVSVAIAGQSVPEIPQPGY